MGKLTVVCWLGNTDLAGITNTHNSGPIATLLKEFADNIEKLVVFSGYTEAGSQAYFTWLKQEHPVADTLLEQRYPAITDPTDYKEIYNAVKGIPDEFGASDLAYYINPGTPTMTNTWIILSQVGAREAKIIQSTRVNDRTYGIKVFNFPYFIKSIYREEVEQKLASLKDFPIHSRFDEIVSQSPAMDAPKKLASCYADFSSTVLILGESGTGKELFAQAIHNASGRASKAFVTINCAAIAETMFESELFGYEKGAFTGADNAKPGLFETANGGTIFLDEIGEMPLTQQAKLLRVLSSGDARRLGVTKDYTVDVRVICATNKDLLSEVNKGTFREDLYYRIETFQIHLPPLRERSGGDVSLLIKALTDKATKHLGRTEAVSYAPAVMSRLEGYHWRGNVRELENVILRLVALSKGSGKIDESFLPYAMLQPAKHSAMDHLALPPIPEGGLDINERLDEVKIHYIKEALRKSKTQSDAAALLKTNPPTLSGWIKKHKITETPEQ